MGGGAVRVDAIRGCVKFPRRMSKRPTLYRLRYYAAGSVGAHLIVEEIDFSASAVAEAVSMADKFPWPPNSNSWRLFDLDGIEIGNRIRADSHE